MGIHPDSEQKPLETKTVKLTAVNLLRAVGNSPIGGPYPRLGKVAGTNRVEIPHILNKATTEEVDEIDLGVGYGEDVIVFTQGEK